MHTFLVTLRWSTGDMYTALVRLLWPTGGKTTGRHAAALRGWGSAHRHAGGDHPPPRPWCHATTHGAHRTHKPHVGGGGGGGGSRENPRGRARSSPRLRAAPTRADAHRLWRRPLARRGGHRRASLPAADAGCRRVHGTTRQRHGQRHCRCTPTPRPGAAGETPPRQTRGRTPIPLPLAAATPPGPPPTRHPDLHPHPHCHNRDTGQQRPCGAIAPALAAARRRSAPLVAATPGATAAAAGWNRRDARRQPLGIDRRRRSRALVPGAAGPPPGVARRQ